MKIRESGMPSEDVWRDFFDPDDTLKKLGLSETIEMVGDVGCGYGTFTIPAGRIVRGMVHAIDIDPQMIASVRAKAAREGLSNVVASHLDIEAGIGLPDASVKIRNRRHPAAIRN